MNNGKTILFNKDDLLKDNYIKTSKYIYLVDIDKLYKIHGEMSKSFIVEDISSILSTESGRKIYVELLQIEKAKNDCCAALNSDLRYKATHDKLTGLFNREPLEKKYLKIKNHDFVYMVMIDIDNFKEINDNYGHDNGDTILRTVAQSINCVDDDSSITSYRCGGEEFVMLFNDCSIDDVIKKVIEVQTNIKSNTEQVIKIFNNGKASPLVQNYRTASIGIAKSNGNFHETFKCADAAMYYAKTNGNKVSVCYNYFNDSNCDNDYLNKIYSLLNESNNSYFNEGNVVSIEKKEEKSK